MITRTYKLVIVNWLIMMFAILTMANSQTANPSYSFPNISCGMDDEIQSSSIVYP